MPYTKPDVFITVDLTAASVTVPSPELSPLIVGEHYHVVKGAFAGFVDAGESTTISYPKLPDSTNDATKKLAVDVISAFSPTVEMILGNGVKVDITDKLSFSASLITKTPIVATHDGVPFSGSIYVSYRALSDQYSGVAAELLEAAVATDLTAYFGAAGVGPANPLGFGMFQAMAHAGIKVSGLSIGDLPDGNGAGTYSGSISNVTLSYAAALDFSKAYDLYMVVPMTSDDYVLDVVLAHVNAQSTTGKQERRMVFSPAITDYWPIRGDETHKVWHSIIGDDASAQTWLNGGKDPVTANAITDCQDNGGLVQCTNTAHGLATDDIIVVAGLTDVTNGNATVTVIDANTFDIQGSTFVTAADTGTWVHPESAIGAEFTTATSEIVRRIATGVGTAFGSYIVQGVSLASGGALLDTLSTTLETENVTVDFFDATDRRFWLTLSSSALELPSTRLRVGDRLHVFGTTFSDAFMATVLYPGVASDDTMVEVKAGAVSYDHFDDTYTNQIRFYREATAKSVVDGIADMCTAYGDERLLLLGPDTVAMSVAGVATDVPAFYVAAQLGAEFCQAGRKPAGAEPGAYAMTGVRDSIVAVWKSSRYFTDDQLNTAAEGGFTWLVNDYVGGPVTTRDTISTLPGTVETRDFILGVERDFLAKAYRKALRPDLRKYRVDAALLSKVNLKAAAIGAKYTNVNSATRTFKNITVKQVTQDENDPSTVILVVEATHLYVLKNIQVTLRIVL
jgi:hypothetical protein